MSDTQTAPDGRIFLTARWLDLVMVNYQVAPDALRPLVPAGTELDNWNGMTFVSLVGFMFREARVFGMRIPFHSTFEEVNLRFYVRRKDSDGWRRGVVFVKELVPRFAIAATARLLYGEKYSALPMRHASSQSSSNSNRLVEYSFRHRGQWNRLGITVSGSPGSPSSGSHEEFITEHYWGYAAQRDGRCIEYRVEHPRWGVWSAKKATVEIDARSIYGDEFAEALGKKPYSAFLADGSAVSVKRGVYI